MRNILFTFNYSACTSRRIDGRSSAEIAKKYEEKSSISNSPLHLSLRTIDALVFVRCNLTLEEVVIKRHGTGEKNPIAALPSHMLSVFTFCIAKVQRDQGINLLRNGIPPRQPNPLATRVPAPGHQTKCKAS